VTWWLATAGCSIGLTGHICSIQYTNMMYIIIYMYTIFVLYQNHGYSMAYWGIPWRRPCTRHTLLRRRELRGFSAHSGSTGASGCSPGAAAIGHQLVRAAQLRRGGVTRGRSCSRRGARSTTKQSCDLGTGRGAGASVPATMA
jgi:hypothetical protein